MICSRCGATHDLRIVDCNLYLLPDFTLAQAGEFMTDQMKALIDIHKAEFEFDPEMDQTHPDIP